MPRVLIVVGQPDGTQSGVLAPDVARAVSALKQAILPTGEGALSAAEWVEVVTPTELASYAKSGALESAEHRICPLTLELPDWLEFPEKEVYQLCRDQRGLRQRLEQWQYLTGAGDFWLPIVLTARGPIYAEVIGSREQNPPPKAAPAHCYIQPVHLADVWRQSLYELGHRLLQSLKAPPAVYLLQFGFQEQTLVFDRLLPFPAVPALASLEAQTPNLFECHWHCLLGKPLYDLQIASANPYRIPDVS